MSSVSLSSPVGIRFEVCFEMKITCMNRVRGGLTVLIVRVNFWRIEPQWLALALSEAVTLYRTYAAQSARVSSG
jgi:hypothetical protein